MTGHQFHLFRLRYFGDEEAWGLAFYSYAHDKYELSVFPNGEFRGSPELALETAAAFHLQDESRRLMTYRKDKKGRKFRFKRS